MNEPKAFATLSSTLLARKGHAKPAMRPQGFAGFGMATAPTHDDLGWNDMGLEVSAPAPASAEIVPIVPQSTEMPAEAAPVETPAVVRQQEELVRELTPSPSRSTARAAPGSKGKAAFTLRLDPDRHLKLRLACAMSHRSAQQIVVEALDTFLATQPAVAEFAATTRPSR